MHSILACVMSGRRYRRGAAFSKVSVMQNRPGRVVVGVAGVALATAGGWAVVAPSGAAATTQQGTWAGASPAAATPAAGDAPDITGAERLVVVAIDHGRGGGVDTGPKGASPGDYYVFQEELTASDGTHLGIDSARCMNISAHNTRCDASFILTGRGSVDVAGSFADGVRSLAVTGGTGAFRNARGEATIVGGAGNRTRFVFSLLP